MRLAVKIKYCCWLDSLWHLPCASLRDRYRSCEDIWQDAEKMEKLETTRLKSWATLSKME